MGDDAWGHLEEAAGSVMATFLDKYVKNPIADVLQSSTQSLPDFTIKLENGKIILLIGDEALEIQRHESPSLATSADLIPDDAGSEPSLS